MKSLNHIVVKSVTQLAKVTALTSILWVGIFVVSTAIALGSFYWEAHTSEAIASHAPLHNQSSTHSGTSPDNTLGIIADAVATTTGAESPAGISSTQDVAKTIAQENSADDGWGAEALEIIHTQAQQLSPITLANACGLGASSCFRCHNDKRAKAPNYSPVDAPWHAQHKSVNYSCTGCHQGNPRILKQEIAHKNLIVNAAAAPEKTCATCHSADEITRLLPVYRASHPRLFENSEGVAP